MNVGHTFNNYTIRTEVNFDEHETTNYGYAGLLLLACVYHAIAR